MFCVSSFSTSSRCRSSGHALAGRSCRCDRRRPGWRSRVGRGPAGPDRDVAHPLALRQLEALHDRRLAGGLGLAAVGAADEGAAYLDDVLQDRQRRHEERVAPSSRTSLGAKPALCGDRPRTSRSARRRRCGSVARPSRPPPGASPPVRSSTSRSEPRPAPARTRPGAAPRRSGPPRASAAARTRACRLPRRDSGRDRRAARSGADRRRESRWPAGPARGARRRAA